MTSADFFKYGSINNRDGCEVDNVALGRVNGDEVDRLVQSHLYRTDNLAIPHFKHHAIGGFGGGEVGEDESVDIFAVETVERISFVA